MDIQFNAPMGEFRPNLRQRIALRSMDGQSFFEEPSTYRHASHFPETCILRVKGREIVTSRREAMAVEKTKILPTIHQSILRGRYEVAKLLIDAGWDVNEQGPFDWTPLHVLAQCYEQYELHSFERLKRMDELAAYLIEKGADVETKDCFGMNPLASANGKGPQSLRRATAKAVAERARLELDSEVGKRGAYEKR